MGLEQFGSVVGQPKIRDRILRGILAAIYRERLIVMEAWLFLLTLVFIRCGESSDRTLLKSLLRMFVDLQVDTCTSLYLIN